MLKANAILAAAVLLLLPLAAGAQTPPNQSTAPPARIGNIWDNYDHQPTRAETREEEKAAGILPDPAQRTQTTDELQQLDQQILRRAQQQNDGVMNGSAAAQPGP